MAVKTDPGAAAYHRNAAAVTDREVSAPKAKGKGGLFSKLSAPKVHRTDPEVQRQAREVIAALESPLPALRSGLNKLKELRRARLLGKPEDEMKRLDKIAKLLEDAKAALEEQDFGACGRTVIDAHRELSALGGSLTIALNQELGQAAFSRELKAQLQDNMEDRKAAQQELAEAEKSSKRQGLLASTSVYESMAQGLELAAEILSGQSAPAPKAVQPSGKTDGSIRVVAPQELETFAEVGGLAEAKERLQRTVGVMLERSGDAASAGLVLNGVLLYGPPGTGKTLLARAVAGEYGLRFIRFSPAAIASAYQHEPAKKLRQLFVLAAENAPCLLFLDEVDTIAGRRESGASNSREIVTQLLNSLEEYRRVPGLIIMAATNTLDDLDPALREGRFDVRIAIPLPDLEARTKVLEVQLEQSGLDVDWDSIDLNEIAEQTAGRSGAAITSLVAGAAERSLTSGVPLGQTQLVEEIEARSGQDRAQTYEEQVTWDDVVLPADVRQRLQEILLVFQKPELGRKLGVRPPAGILLYGPPGTGKTTIAKALATEVKASFYEHSAADLLSKWVGESEQKVAQLFTRARANRPSIIFIDEIDTMLKRRQSDSSSPWEERVVSQFLRELDGLQTGQGVLLVGATNRVDIIDEAVRERRLAPIEVPLPDVEGRVKLLEVLCRDVTIGPDVNLARVAAATDGMSGAHLKQVRNSAGMKALSRTAVEGGSDAAVTEADFAAALQERGFSLDGAPRAKPKSTKTKPTSTKTKPTASANSKTSAKLKTPARKSAAKPKPIAKSPKAPSKRS
ncbi:MAG: AAA family ATPase [Actinomycetota bacterium]